MVFFRFFVGMGDFSSGLATRWKVRQKLQKLGFMLSLWEMRIGDTF